MGETYKPLQDESSAPPVTKGDGIYMYEEFLGKMKYGKFFFAHLFICSLAVMADSIEVMSLSMILPSATCDLQLTSGLKGWIDAAVFIGMMFGGVVWGTLADVSGRRFIMLMSLTVNWVAALSSSFVSDHNLFLILRLISGIGIGGSVPVIFAYFIEFQHKSHRGMMGCILTSAWMMGNVIQAAIAWAIIPSDIGIVTTLIDYTGWRLYIGLCAIPSFLSVILLIFMPESPKYYLQEEREGEAIQILENIYRLNNNKEIKIKTIKLSGGEETLLVRNEESQNEQCCMAVFKRVGQLFVSKYRNLTLVTIVLIGFFSFGYYGLFMWFPELFRRMSQTSGSGCSFYAKSNSTEVVTQLFNVSASNDPCDGPSSSVYLQSLITMATTAAGPILPIFLIDWLGRRPLFAGSILCTGSSLFAFYFITSPVQGFIISSVFAFFSSTVYAIFDVFAVELYPTRLRSTAFGLFTSAIRIASIVGNVSFGMLIDEHCSVIIILPTVLIFIAGFISFWIPDMTFKDID